MTRFLFLYNLTLKRMKLLAYIVLILQAASGYAQVSYQDLVPLQSRGEIPEFMRPDCRFLKFDQSQTPYLSTGKSTPDEIDAVFRSLASNGRIVYGEEVHAFCSSLLRNLLLQDSSLNQQIEIYPFKSSLASILNDGNSRIYISTALIARADKIEQLSFLIATQLYHIQAGSLLESVKLNRQPNLNSRLAQLDNYDSTAISKADSFAFSINERLNFDPYFLLEGLELLRFRNDPIEQVSVPANYFNSDLMTVPASLFERSNYRLEKRLPNPYSIKLLKREEELGKHFIGTARVEYLADNPYFELVRNLCTFQYVEDLLLENKPDEALYHLYILEKRGLDPQPIARLKAHSWLNIAQKRLYPVYKRTAVYRQLFDSPGSVFYLGLYRLTVEKNGAMALSLRMITDLARETNDPEIGLIRNYLIDLIRKSGEFHPDLFSKQPLATSTDGTSTKTPFYFYAISDLVSDPGFIELITGTKPVYETNEEPPIMLLVEPTAYLFHKKKFREEKTESKTKLLLECIENNSIYQEINTYTLVPDTVDKTAWTKQYNLRYAFNAFDRQMRNQSDYLRPVFPLNYKQLTELTADQPTHLLGIFHFENQYNLNIQGYHLIGIFGVPLPFVLTDLILGGNHCQFVSIVIDKTSGRVLSAENSKYRDPLTRPFIKNKVQHTFQTIFKSDSGL